MPELTQRQEMVLDFIRDFIAARGMAPTVREIMDQFHWSSPTGVVCHLKALKKKGQITWTQGLARSIQLTEKSRGIPVVNLGMSTVAKKKSQAEELLLADLIAAGYQPEAECDFHSEANWKFDLAFPEIKLAIEIDGAGRHNMLQGQRRDQNKRNAALELGWRVLLYPAASVTTAKRRERIVEQISRVICGVACEQQSTIVLEGD